jgi:hypothetical protein
VSVDFLAGGNFVMSGEGSISPQIPFSFRFFLVISHKLAIITFFASRDLPGVILGAFAHDVNRTPEVLM